jgi:hypothetical protein
MKMTHYWVLSVSRLLQEFKFPPKLLGYLMGLRWGAPAVLMQKSFDFLNYTWCAIGPSQWSRGQSSWLQI